MDLTTVNKGESRNRSRDLAEGPLLISMAATAITGWSDLLVLRNAGTNAVAMELLAIDRNTGRKGDEESDETQDQQHRGCLEGSHFYGCRITSQDLS